MPCTTSLTSARRDRTRTDAGDQEQLGEIARANFRSRGQRTAQPVQEHIGRPHVVMHRHLEMGNGRILTEATQQCYDTIGIALHQLNLRRPRGRGAMIGQVDDLSLMQAIDRRVWLVDEALEPVRQPVVPPCLAPHDVHPLLDNRPCAVIGHHEAVQVEIESVLHSGAIDLRDETAGARQRIAIHTDTLADGAQLRRCVARMPAAAAADVYAELMLDWCKPAFQCSHDAGGDAGRVPVHSHHRAEGLKPEWMGQTPEELVAPVFVHDRFDDHPAQARHPLREPRWDPAAVQRKVGAPGSSCHRARSIRRRAAAAQERDRVKTLS